MTNSIPYRYRIYLFLFFLILITYLDRISIALVGVRIKSSFHLTNEQFGWALASFSLAYAIFEIPSGMLGDRIGQRAVFIRIVLWWSLFTAITGLATGLGSLIVIRFLFGMGEAGAFPTSAAVVSRWFPASETTRGMSSMFLGLNVGAALAPLLVIPVAAAYGWRAPFFVNAAIGLVWVFVCYGWFRNNPSEMKGISPGEKKLIEENRRYVRHAGHFPWRIVVGNRSLRALVAAFFCSQWGNYFFISWMPVYLQEGKHFSENEVKLTTFFIFITGILMALLAGILSDWMIRKTGIRITRRLFGFLAQGGLALALVGASLSTDHGSVAIALLIGHLFFAANGLVSFSACVDIGGSHAGAVAGIMNFFGQSGGFLLSILFGKIADLSKGFNAPVYLLVAVLVAGSILWLFVNPAKPVTEK